MKLPRTIVCRRKVQIHTDVTWIYSRKREVQLPGVVSWVTRDWLVTGGRFDSVWELSPDPCICVMIGSRLESPSRPPFSPALWPSWVRAQPQWSWKGPPGGVASSACRWRSATVAADPHNVLWWHWTMCAHGVERLVAPRSPACASSSCDRTSPRQRSDDRGVMRPEGNNNMAAADRDENWWRMESQTQTHKHTYRHTDSQSQTQTDTVVKWGLLSVQVFTWVTWLLLLLLTNTQWTNSPVWHHQHKHYNIFTTWPQHWHNVNTTLNNK